MVAEVSIVVNGHREGLLAAPSLRSARRARALAEKQGVVVETLYVLDQADHDTVEQFRFGADSDARFLEVGFGDLGLARNAGVAASTGGWIAFLDADDLWGDGWIADAFACTQAYGRPAVWHPEINIRFAGAESLFLHPDSEDARFDAAGLAAANYWTALCFAPRSVLIDTPYPASAVGIAYEDWSWNLAVLARGIPHKIVPGALHAIRDRPGSLGKSIAAGALPLLPSMYRELLMRRGFSSPPRSVRCSV